MSADSLTRKLTILRPDLDGPRRAPASAEAAPPPSAWAILLRRLRIRRSRDGRDRFRVAPRQVREARLAECVPGKCESAQAMPGYARAKCLAKGCGCDDLHAVRLDALCPRGRWTA